ncbi:MAG: GLPGLI family protein [Leeuwenhoekiella sp.]
MKFKLANIIVFCIAFALCPPTGGEAMTAQDFQGTATYKSRRSIDLKMSSNKGMTDAMQKQMEEQLKKQFEKTHTLNFNRTESLYTEDEKLAAPSAPTGGMQIKISESQDILYKNTSQKRYVRKEDVMGKIFLVKDSLEMPHWKMQKETKNIGQYTCYKAIWTKSEKHSTMDDGLELVDTLITREIVAWYTPQIPVSNGPEDYWGLPGLILEIQNGKQSILCSEIVLNPKEAITIEAPDRGKEVNEANFKEIQDDKMKEWIERNSTGNGKDGNITIKIGGS